MQGLYHQQEDPQREPNFQKTTHMETDGLALTSRGRLPGRPRESGAPCSQRGALRQDEAAEGKG